MTAHAFPHSRRPSRPEVGAALLHSAVLTISCLISYWLITDLLARVHSLSAVDQLLGGMWTVIATVFVYRTSYRRTVRAAVSRIAATLLSLALCLAYLALFAFQPVGMAVLIGAGTLVLMLIGRPDEVVTTAITTAVVMVVAALSPRDAWEQPILRLVDTGVGVAVGLSAAWIAQRLAALRPKLHPTSAPLDDRAQCPAAHRLADQRRGVAMTDRLSQTTPVRPPACWSHVDALVKKISSRSVAHTVARVRSDEP